MSVFRNSSHSRVRRRLSVVASLGAAVGLLVAPAEAVLPEPVLSPATVSVDFSSNVGKLPRTERLNNFSTANIYPAQRQSDVDFLNSQGLHGSIYRVWSSGGPVCDVQTRTCTLPDAYADYLRQASEVSDAVLLNSGNPTLVAGQDPGTIYDAFYLRLKFLKERFPKITHVEVFNEPDYKYYGARVSNPVVKPDELYRYYAQYAKAVAAVNAELQPAVPLKVGGPALAGFHTEWLEAFLTAYGADPDPGKRLDFLSYHGYGYFDPGFSTFTRFAPAPSQVAGQRTQIDAWLAANGLSTELPALLTETGIYPGPSFDDPSGRTDYLVQAAGLASLHYWWNKQHDIHPFHWVVRHQTDERKDMLVSRVLPGIPVVPGITPNLGQPLTPSGIPVKIFTPYGNMMLMQSKMKDRQVDAVSDELAADGKGVYGVAAKDSTGASVMVWNYQHTDLKGHRTTIDMKALPQQLRNRPVRQRLFRIDQTTSNFFTDPQSYLTPDASAAERNNLQQVSDTTITLSPEHKVVVDLDPNALYLLLLEPVEREVQAG